MLMLMHTAHTSLNLQKLHWAERRCLQVMFMTYGREVSPETADLAAELLGFNPEQVLSRLG